MNVFGFLARKFLFVYVEGRDSYFKKVPLSLLEG
jgi:hypothetical protein